MLSSFYRQGKETQRDLVMPKVTSFFTMVVELGCDLKQGNFCMVVNLEGRS